MKSKRKKWTDEEDRTLLAILGEEDNLQTVNWDLVSREMEQLSFMKNAKQCRERWMHQLDPQLKKEKWSKKDNKRLFTLYSQIGCKWKEIAEHFKGRSDNSIKNQFFSLI